jgi:hypothetical protein
MGTRLGILRQAQTEWSGQEKKGPQIEKFGLLLPGKLGRRAVLKGLSPHLG